MLNLNDAHRRVATGPGYDTRLVSSRCTDGIMQTVGETVRTSYWLELAFLHCREGKRAFSARPEPLLHSMLRWRTLACSSTSPGHKPRPIMAPRSGPNSYFFSVERGSTRFWPLSSRSASWVGCGGQRRVTTGVDYERDRSEGVATSRGPTTYVRLVDRW